MIITIDGPAGTGKTTVAKKVAEKLGLTFFDTGAMYRALTYHIMRKKIALEDEKQLLENLKEFQFLISKDGNSPKYFVNQEDVTEAIRTPEVTKQVSAVSAHPAVRSLLTSLQRKFAEKGNAVFEGRDMGATVLPQAQVKVFLTARPAVRAERRYLEMKDKSTATNQDEVLQDLLERDRYDSTREYSPLQQAKDAYLIDTSDMTIEQVVDQIVSLTRKKKSS